MNFVHIDDVMKLTGKIQEMFLVTLKAHDIAVDDILTVNKSNLQKDLEEYIKANEWNEDELTIVYSDHGQYRKLFIIFKSWDEINRLLSKTQKLKAFL